MEIIHAYGYDAQSRQCIEEMAELTQAINKFWRKQLKCGQIKVNQVSVQSEEYKNLVEELADVQIMLEQMSAMLGCGEDIMAIRELKLDRQMERIQYHL